jgi:hypothetical protein
MDRKYGKITLTLPVERRFAGLDNCNRKYPLKLQDQRIKCFSTAQYCIFILHKRFIKCKKFY